MYIYSVPKKSIISIYILYKKKKINKVSKKKKEDNKVRSKNKISILYHRISMYKQKQNSEKDLLSDHLLVFLLLPPPDFRAFFDGDELPSSLFPEDFFFEDLDCCCPPSFSDS